MLRGLFIHARGKPIVAGIAQFFRVTRSNFTCKKKMLRCVYLSEIVTTGEAGSELEAYLADRVPLFYRTPERITSTLNAGYFLTAMKEALIRLPASESFRESHMGEILSGIVAEEVLGLPRLYSKLTLTTAENENPKKMDLLLYDPTTDPVELVLGEVKCSPKDEHPALHHKSCFPSLFKSLNTYTAADIDFDLSAANDHLKTLPEPDAKRVRAALAPYAGTTVRYAGFIVIDHATKDPEEISLLATRSSTKTFDVDVLCVERFGSVADCVYSRLAELRAHV